MYVYVDDRMDDNNQYNNDMHMNLCNEGRNEMCGFVVQFNSLRIQQLENRSRARRVRTAHDLGHVDNVVTQLYCIVCVCTFIALLLYWIVLDCISPLIYMNHSQ
jgi:hypothetical protein